MKGINKTTIALCLAMWLTATSAIHTIAQESPQAYIEQYKDAAIQHMEEHGCPASIILAIAMHESAHGTSRVARHLNNHFGIKGPNDSKEIRSAYKGYSSVEESYQDFIDFLKRRKRTVELFDLYEPHEYQKWVQGIARSGYAHSTSWSSKVINIIRKYNLHELDKKPEGMVLAAAEMPEEAAWYTVKRGDTLYDIARKYGTTVQTIQRNNGLTDSRLRIGQQLLL
ncbi:glucosaminidase domain-containing protein [Parapedobacter sp. ISTM3]|uniref:Peptidoglycan hydrolase n=1 Tax=Parapedobacter luteus TaxID=623280 RepID=A0A1T5DHA2_9SPHI|nr:MULTISPECIES: glucosaminidase domain-containing protein [Parapedobacter]MBK1442041.1 glucosaminidase domain-containing protein [Parapedobacter sp. ISTM3]SKB71084.1 Flagellum-specific peptidoglycan hydrolase FlgJ [Parapedobacter luteus]SKB92621.1 Flagellum-specific peptidoglycan hydrolase FlgJ [Parapedobacter luteus]